jgi:transposase
VSDGAVDPHRISAFRKAERERGKSDQIDALAIARAVLNGRDREVPGRLSG